MPILLDDLVLAAAGLCGLGYWLLSASARGELTIPYSNNSVLFGCLLVLKTVTLFFLAVQMPLVSSVMHEYGVAFTEGVLVLTKSLFFLVAYTFILKSLRDWEDRRNALYFVVLCITLTAAYGLFQFFVLGHHTLTSTFRNIYEMSKVVPGVWEYQDPWFQDATVGHEHFGAYMTMAFSLCAGLLLYGFPERRSRRLGLVVLCACCAFNLIYASSRGAWIGATCSLVALVLWQLAEGKLKEFISYYVVLSLVIAGLVYGLDLSPVEYVGKRVEGLVTSSTIEGVLTNTQGQIKDVSARDRVALFMELWNRFSQRPLVGWGAGGAGRIAEGQFIRELTEGGIIGSMLFFGFLYSCVSIARRHYREARDPLVKGCNMGLACGIAGMAGQSLFTELFILTKVGASFWVTVAVVQSMGWERAPE